MSVIFDLGPAIFHFHCEMISGGIRKCTGVAIGSHVRVGLVGVCEKTNGRMMRIHCSPSAG